MTDSIKLILPMWLFVLLPAFPQFSETIYTPSLPNIAASLGTSDAFVEMTLSIYFAGFALGVFIWGWLSDKFGRRPTMLLGIAIYGLGCFGCYHSVDIYSLLICRAIQAFGASVGSVVFMAMLRDSFEGKERSRMFNIIGAVNSFAPAVGPVFGGYISDYYSWSANFIFLIAISIFLFIACLIKLPETRPKSKRSTIKINLLALLKKMFTDQALLGHTLLIGATNGILFSFYGEAPFLFTKLLGFTAGQYGFLGVFLASIFLASALLSQYLGKFFSHNYLIKVGSIIAFSGACLASLLAHFGWFANGVSPWILGCNFAAFLIIFLGNGLLIPNSLSIALSKYSDVVGTAGSIFGISYYILITLFTAGMSLLHNGTATAMPFYFIFLSMGTLFGSYLVNRQAYKPALQTNNLN
jgi:Bcr/CflA subfamily drug resistance transporter